MATVILGFDQGIQRVRDLEKMQRLAEADEMLDAVIRATARVLEKEPDGFVILLRALDEAELRHRYDLMNAILEALKSNPASMTEQGYVVLKSRGQLFEARLSHGRDGASVFYICQNCGNPIAHLSAQCPDCGFLPRDVKSTERGIFLSSSQFDAATLLWLGSRIQLGLEFDQLHPDFTKRFAHFESAEDARTADLVGFILHACQKAEASERPVLTCTGTCRSCGHSNKPRFWTMSCEACAGGELAMPAMSHYKLVLRDSLYWLQHVPRFPPNHPELGLLVAELTSLKERAVHDGRVAAQAAGAFVKRLLEGLGTLTDVRNRCKLEFNLYGLKVTPLIADFEPDREPDRVANSGPVLFNRLTEYLFQGTPVV